MTLELYSYQKECVEKMLTLGGRGGIFFDVGTGKTPTALTIAARLNVCRVLVVAPLGPVVEVWRDEIHKHFPAYRFLNCTRGSLIERGALLRAAPTVDPTIAVVGYESFWQPALQKAILSWAPDLVIYDEAHRLKNRGTRQSRFSAKLVTLAPHALALTGTPMTKGPEDLFGVFRAIDPAVFGTRWADFEGRFLKVSRWGGFPKIEGYRNREELERLIRKHSSRVLKKDALDLPEEVDVMVPIELDKPTRKLYQRLKQDAIAEVDALTGETGRVVSRVIITNLLRLMQVTGGFVRVTDGRDLDVGSEKLDAFADLVAEMLPRRVVVFCRFRHSMSRLEEVVQDMGIPAFMMHGDVPPEDRNTLLEKFRKVDAGVLICQLQVASVGMDLTCSDVAFFYDLDYDLMHYIQARGRLHRHGQRNNVTFYHLLADKTIDTRVYKALLLRSELVSSIVDRPAAHRLFEE